MFQPLTLEIINLTVKLVIIPVTILMIMYHIHRFTYWRRRGIHHLKPVFPFGVARDFLLGRISFAEQIRDWYCDMKRRGWTMGGSYFYIKEVCILVDERLIKQVLIKDFSYFPHRGFFVNEKVDPLSGHVLNLGGYKWKNLRAKLPAAFTTAKMRRDVVTMEAISRQFIVLLNELTQRDKSINIKEILARVTRDMFAACAFGMETRTIYNENKELVKHSKSFVDYHWSRTVIALVYLFPRRILSFLRFRSFPVATTKYFMDMFSKIKDHRENEIMKRNDLTDILIGLCDKTKHLNDFSGQGKMDTLSFRQFASQMYILFHTGFEASSRTQTFALYELAINSEIQEKLRKEINDVLRKYNGDVGYDSVSEMEYLDRIICETLRKYPIVPTLPRKCVKDYRISDTNLKIEKGTIMLISLLGVHHNPNYYPNPKLFDPDRFTHENKAKRPHCSYLPFGDGPRACIGKRFGIWQTKLGLISVIRNFKVTLSRKMELPLRFDEHGFLLEFKGDVWIDLEKIN